MQHMDGVGQISNVNHAVCSRWVANPDHAHAHADGRHWLPVGRFCDLLYLVKFVDGKLARFLRKLAKEIERIPLKSNLLECHGENYITIHIAARSRIVPAVLRVRPLVDIGEETHDVVASRIMT